jgi:hypothetical protein
VQSNLVSFDLDAYEVFAFEFAVGILFSASAGRAMSAGSDPCNLLRCGRNNFALISWRSRVSQVKSCVSEQSSLGIS